MITDRLRKHVNFILYTDTAQYRRDRHNAQTDSRNDGLLFDLLTTKSIGFFLVPKETMSFLFLSIIIAQAGKRSDKQTDDGEMERQADRRIALKSFDNKIDRFLPCTKIETILSISVNNYCKDVEMERQADRRIALKSFDNKIDSFFFVPNSSEHLRRPRQEGIKRLSRIQDSALAEDLQ
ncbi:hypothetical protein J6590_047124 [Homalodisca vitripennis]|nr:hypothetical protein J6590_047124 [Homalodisca vitripennis]